MLQLTIEGDPVQVNRIVKTNITIYLRNLKNKFKKFYPLYNNLAPHFKMECISCANSFTNN